MPNENMTSLKANKRENTTLPLALVQIPGFSIFTFSTYNFQKNSNLLILYPKHIIKLLGYILGRYTSSMSKMTKSARKMNLPTFTKTFSIMPRGCL